MPLDIKDTSNEFSKFVVTDINERLQPMNKLIDGMQARLEEFQTMVYFAKQERINASNLLETIQNSYSSIEDLFERIDTVEVLVDHVKNTVNSLEIDIEKAEEEIGYTDNSATAKVANIFTPLFKKNNADKTEPPSPSHMYKTTDYFHPSSE